MAKLNVNYKLIYANKNILYLHYYFCFRTIEPCHDGFFIFININYSH